MKFEGLRISSKGGCAACLGLQEGLLGVCRPVVHQGLHIGCRCPASSLTVGIQRFQLVSTRSPLSQCLGICLFIYPAFCLPTCLTIFLSSTNLPVYLIYLSICTTTYLSYLSNLSNLLSLSIDLCIIYLYLLYRARSAFLCVPLSLPLSPPLSLSLSLSRSHVCMYACLDMHCSAFIPKSKTVDSTPQAMPNLRPTASAGG